MNTIDSKLNDGIFDAMLKVACEEVMDSQISAWSEEDTDDYEFSSEFERKMSKLLQSRKRQARVIKMRKTLSRVAVVILAVMALGFTFVMSVEAMRVQLFNTVRDIHEEYIGFTFDRQAQQPADISGFTPPAYIPEGYWEEEVEHTPGFRSAVYYYNDNGERIIYDQFIMSDGLNLQIDGEHIGSEYTLEIGGITVQVYETNADGHDNYVIWDDGIHFYMISGTIQPSELIEMARSVIS